MHDRKCQNCPSNMSNPTFQVPTYELLFITDNSVRQAFTFKTLNHVYACRVCVCLYGRLYPSVNFVSHDSLNDFFHFTSIASMLPLWGYSKCTEFGSGPTALTTFRQYDKILSSSWLRLLVDGISLRVCLENRPAIVIFPRECQTVLSEAKRDAKTLRKWVVYLRVIHMYQNVRIDCCLVTLILILMTVYKWCEIYLLTV